MQAEVGHFGDTEVRVQRYKTVTISGQQVTALLNTGSFCQQARRHVVFMRIIILIPKLTVTIDEQPYLLTAGVVENLPINAILGWDLSVLMDLLREKELPVGTDSGEDVEVDVSCPVMT